METWTSTTKTILAAALGTLGIPIRLEKMLDEKSGTGRRDFFLGQQSFDGKYQTGPLKSQFESGALMRDQPEHPVTDIIWAKHSRDRILDAVNKGTRIELVKQAGSTTRTFYHPGGSSSFPGVQAHGDLFETKDLNQVAAFTRFGIPILTVTGQRGGRTFTLPIQARLSGSMETVGEVAKAWMNKSLSDEHEFSYAMHGLLNYARLVKEMHSETEHVLIRKPGSRKSAFVDPATTDAGLDKMRKFLIG